MIHAIAQVLDAQAALPVVHGWGLADATPDGPAVHQGGGQYTPVAVDGYATWSYWRLTSGPSTTLSDIGGGCGDGIRHDLTMRLVVMLDNDCDAMQVMLDAARALPMASKALRTTTGAAIATVDRRHIITDGIQGSERIGAVPLHRRLIAMDVQLVLLGLRDCLSGCPPVDVTCAIIAAASDAKVVSCLGDRLDGLCGSAGPCAPTTVNGTQSDTPTITVLQGGEQVGTLNPATGVHTVPECDPCPVPECDDLVDAVVVEGAGDSESNGLYRFDGYGGPAGIMAAKKYRNANDHIIAASDFDAPDGPFGWTLYDSLLTAYYSGGSLPFNVFPSQGQWASIYGEAPAPTVRQATIADLCPCDECEDATVQLKDSAGNNIGSAYVISPGATSDITVGDSTITLPNGMTKAVKATQPYTVPQTAPLKFSFSPYDQGSDLWTVTADEAGSYNAYTQDGVSGTITYSKNGGAFAALSGTITLAVGDTIQVKRTTITAAGWSRWQRQVTP